jgi:hypothetical protein
MAAIERIIIEFDGKAGQYNREGSMYKLKLICHGMPTHAGPQAAIDITEEFTHRPWHRNITCAWDGSELVLEAENDNDENGLALQDEFSDAISACVSEGFDGNIIVESVTKI